MEKENELSKSHPAVIYAESSEFTGTGKYYRRPKKYAELYVKFTALGIFEKEYETQLIRNAMKTGAGAGFIIGMIIGSVIMWLIQVFLQVIL